MRAGDAHLGTSEETRMRKVTKLAAALAMTGFGLAAPAFGQSRPLAMLDRLDAGKWELRMREDGARTTLCIPNGRRLIQLRHPNEACDRLVIEDAPNQVAVQYTCRGRGYGLTRIRRETNQLVQIESQGIAEGLPFDFTVEARRVGSCAY